MLIQFRLLIFIFIGFIYADIGNWNSTTFEYLWNKYAFNTKYREQIEITPFEVRISELSYIGKSLKSEYFLPFPWMEINESDTSMIITSLITSIPKLADYENRKLNSIEIDKIRYNFLKKYINQNLIDIQSGITYNRMEGKTGLTLPSGISGWGETPQQIIGEFEYNPIIESSGIRTTFTWKPTHYFQFTSGTFFGYSIGTVYKSNGGNRYLWGAGSRWNISMAAAFVVEDNDKNFNYLFSLGFQSGEVRLNKINDNKYGISPITGIDLYTYGWNFAIGVQYGGRRTMGDRGFRRVVEDDYIGAVERLGQFIRMNPAHPRIPDAKILLGQCEQRIPFQAYKKGMEALSQKDYSITGYWLKQAMETNSDNIKTLAKFQLDKIAQTLLDSVKNNLDKFSLKDAEELVLMIKNYSNQYSKEADIIRGKIYLAQGDILLKNGQYSRSLSKYQEALFISDDLINLVNEKEKTLAKAFLLDASKGFKQGELIFIIESLKQSNKLNPNKDSEYNQLVSILENLK